MEKPVQGFVYRRSIVRNGRSTKVGAYRARYTDADGVVQDHIVILPNGLKTRDKATAESVLVTIKKRVERKASGLVDPEVESAGLPMRVVVGRFARAHRRQVSRGHMRQVIQQAKWCIDNGPIRRLADFKAITIDQVLRKLTDNGKTARTVNAYRRTLFTIGEWAENVAQMTNQNPVRKLKPVAEGDEERRFSLSVEQAYRLLEVAPPDRRLAYAFWIWTGLRVDETRNIQWRDLRDLDGDRPGLRVRPEITKTKRGADLPLHSDLAKLLIEHKGPFVKPTDRVFKTLPSLKTVKGYWYRQRGNEKAPHEPRWADGDFGRAGIPLVDDDGRHIDRHAFRKTFATWLTKADVHPRKQNRLTRHKERDVAGRHYTDHEAFDLWAEIEKLPRIPPVKKQQEEQRATGTDGKCSPGGSPGVGAINGRQKGGKSPVKSGRNPREKGSLRGSLEKRIHKQKGSFGGIGATGWHSPESSKNIEKIACFAGKNDYRWCDSNARPSDPQSDALTN